MPTQFPPIAGQNYVAGEWASRRDDFPSRNPANLAAVVGQFPVATPDEVKAAVQAARDAFPMWRRTSRIIRAECFDRLAQIIKRDTDDLATLMARECGKNLTECRAEVVEGLHMVQYVFGSGRGRRVRRGGRVRDRGEGRVHAAEAVGRGRGHHAVELPVRGAAVDARAVLLEGNTCVFKPSEETPAIAQRLVELFAEAGFPRGTVNLDSRAGRVGEALVKNPGVNVVCFTGSYDVGRSGFSRCPRRSRTASSRRRWAGRTRSSCATTRGSTWP